MGSLLGQCGLERTVGNKRGGQEAGRVHLQNSKAPGLREVWSMRTLSSDVIFTIMLCPSVSLCIFVLWFRAEGWENVPLQ